ncbi:hypothetical protein NX784_12450 [Massilia pinisoli]|uniref:Flagellar protein FliT n=1 Tax=Massilia pinisoli TaxID=1772194 RepID=A0ABT1ZR55_9BURK|nr:hypothetical protein [Massilia pinisoli]MCS0582403.1 hypothetical protein [Massilia pinisoli]
MADPLDRQAKLAQLGDAMQAAAARADWDRLATQVRALMPALRALAEQGPWNAAERTALERVRAQHTAAATAAAAAGRALASRLEDMRANKEGWVAYAMYSETELDPIQE